MKIKIIFLLTTAFGFTFLGSFVRAEETVLSHAIDVIDSPTASVVDHYGWNVAFRFGQNGNLQAKPVFGVFPRLNLGFGLDGEQIIGTEDARLNTPTLNVKFRIFDGKGIIPAFALGYDGQGYVYNKDIGEYEQRQLGFYAAGESEIFISNMFLSFGINKYDFDHGGSPRGFAGWSYVYQQTVGLLAEYTQIGNYDERRINYGLRYFVTPMFTIDLIGRNIPDGVETSARLNERVVRLGYTGSF